MAPQDIADLAKRFIDAIEAGDIVAVAECYAEDAVIWHNTDGLETSKTDNLQTLADFVRQLPVRRYQDRRVSITAEGFVQQHTLSCPRRDGSARELHAVLVCQVRDGRISRLDEYFDSAELAAWRRSVPPPPER